MKEVLRRVLRDVLTIAALLGLIFSAAELWDEKRQSSASDFEMPTLPAARGESPGPGRPGDPGEVDFVGLRRATPEAAAWLTVPEIGIN